jgi:hypothetical protein
MKKILLDLYKRTIRYIEPNVILISALSISVSAVVYSVTGLADIFNGGNSIRIMAGSLEIAKLVLAASLHNQWSNISKLLRTYLVIAVVVLMAITSAGIFGFLSASFQKTADKDNIHQAKIQILSDKLELYDSKLSFLLERDSTLNVNSNKLTNALSGNQIIYYNEAGEKIVTTSSSTRKTIEKRLKVTDEQIAKNEVELKLTQDSVFKYKTKIVESESQSESSGELAALKYVANITKSSLEDAAKWVILLIVFVFDPLAVTMVIFGVTVRHNIREKYANDDDVLNPQSEDESTIDISNSVYDDSEIQSVLRHSVKGNVVKRTQNVPNELLDTLSEYYNMDVDEGTASFFEWTTPTFRVNQEATQVNPTSYSIKANTQETGVVIRTDGTDVDTKRDVFTQITNGSKNIYNE